MHTKRVPFAFVMLVVCRLILGDFASPAAARSQPLVVTTLTDTADPPFNADSPCGTGTVGDLPGADGLVSLREAIIAANHTPGAHTVTFAPNLSGGTIVVNPDPLPALCGGHTHIEGDLNGDGVPDITLEGSAFSAATRAAGIFVLSSHNTIRGLRVAHFPVGIRVIAGDATTPATIKHTTVTNNIVSDSVLSGIVVRTGDAPGSLLAHTTITDNEVTGAGLVGIAIVSFGVRNTITDATIAGNTASANGDSGINVIGGDLGADRNTVDVRIKDNTTADNGCGGIVVLGGDDNSSNNRIVAQVRGNTTERNACVGIAVNGGIGKDNLPTGTSNNNEVDAGIEQNLVRNNGGTGIGILAGVGNIVDGSPGGVADHNHVRALIRRNVVQGSAIRGIEVAAGGPSVANANTLDVLVTRNTACHNTGADIWGEGGFTGEAVLPTPNQGSGNELAGIIAKNTATTVAVADGAPGNTDSYCGGA